ncbi:hypothetical protein QBC45DRAFT_460237 [Copromyces sp. CBS 386.78]|nr:hypothetical protein QBC45DRAFT_460237 [Copromyces sp. CBS 386.78]
MSTEKIVTPITTLDNKSSMKPVEPRVHEGNQPRASKAIVRRYKLRGNIQTHDGNSQSSQSSTPSPPSNTVATLGLATIHEDPVHEGPGYVHQDDAEKQSSSSTPCPSLSTSTTSTTNNTTNNNTTTTTTNNNTTTTTTNNNDYHMTSAFDLMEQHGIDINTVTKEQWDEIMGYQVAYVRRQRREKRKGAARNVDCRGIFSSCSVSSEEDNLSQNNFSEQ